VAGISVVGQDYYGVFPLRGKLLNVREATTHQQMENKDKILGLQEDKIYDSIKSLRYGHLMIMTDQVSLVAWTIQGLGTSTSKEGKEYFIDLDKHKKDFVWVDEKDGDAIELAFSRKKIEARKNWLRQFELIEWERRAKVLINEIISRYENYWQRNSLYAAADPNLLSHGDATNQEERILKNLDSAAEDLISSGVISGVGERGTATVEEAVGEESRGVELDKEKEGFEN
ncbi:hypothetical protein KI387_037363, partial [Taxus chinensis]